jgi:hypothetical protein
VTVDPDGDPACWLDRVCDLCGGFLQGGQPHECRPAAPRPPSDDAARGRPAREPDL